MSQLSALMVHIFGFWWAYFFGFFVFVVYFHITVFSGVGRKFCSIWPSCQTCQSKSLISGLIIPNIPCFFFEMSECRQGLSFFLSFFLLTKLCRTYLCTEKPREDFIHCCAIQTLKRWIIFFNRSLHVRSPVWSVQLLTCICKSKHTFEVSLSRMQSCSLFAQTVLTAVKLMQNYKQKLQIKSPMVVLIFLTFWKGPYRENKTLISYFLSKRSLKIKSRMLS